MSEELENTGKVKQRQERRRNIPAHLRLTKEQKREAEVRQQELASQINSPYAGLTPEGALQARAPRLEQEWRQQRRHIHRQMLKGGTVEEMADLSLAYDRASHQLAEALSEQGRFEEAANVEPDKQERALYRAYHRAVMIDDDETCGDECRAKFERDPGLVFQHGVEKWIISIKHGGRLMPVVICHVCNHRNVRPLPHHLIELRKHRDKAFQLTKGREPHEAAELLRGKRMTTKELFRLEIPDEQ